jgi:hypothetical protein
MGTFDFAPLYRAKTQYHEGQEVEVYDFRPGGWCKAKVVQSCIEETEKGYWMVQFPDGSRAVFEAKNIRAIRSIPIASSRKLLEVKPTKVAA